MLTQIKYTNTHLILLLYASILMHLCKTLNQIVTLQNAKKKLSLLKTQLLFCFTLPILIQQLSILGKRVFLKRSYPSLR